MDCEAEFLEKIKTRKETSKPVHAACSRTSKSTKEQKYTVKLKFLPSQTLCCGMTLQHNQQE